MDRKDVTNYLVTLPERLVRSAVGLGAGLAREVSDIVLPDAVRQGQLYRNLVDIDAPVSDRAGWWRRRRVSRRGAAGRRLPGPPRRR